jgi:hypothetical protein
MKRLLTILTLALTAYMRADTNLSLDVDANKLYPAARGEVQNFHIFNEENVAHATISWKQYYKQTGFTASFGGGFRHYINDVIVGANAFFDVSDHSGFFVPQNSLGFEFITDYFDLRSNFYVPWRKFYETKKSEIRYFNSFDVHFIYKLLGICKIGFNPYFDLRNKREGMNVELSFNVTKWANVGLHAGSDFEKNKNFGIRFTFGLYSLHHDLFSGVRRNYHINYVKTPKIIRKPLLPAQFPSTPLIKPPVEPELFICDTPPPSPPVQPVSDPAPFFLWRWLGLIK